MSTMGFSHREHPYFQQLAAKAQSQAAVDPAEPGVTDEDCHAIIAGSRGGVILDLTQEKA